MDLTLLYPARYIKQPTHIFNITNLSVCDGLQRSHRASIERHRNHLVAETRWKYITKFYKKSSVIFVNEN